MKVNRGKGLRSVEQRTENPCVAGSIPAHTTKKTQSNLGLFYAYQSAKLEFSVNELVKFIKKVPIVLRLLGLVCTFIGAQHWCKGFKKPNFNNQHLAYSYFFGIHTL